MKKVFWLLTFLVLLFPLATVSAHDVTPQTAAPADGALLEKSPPEVRLIFPEEILPNGSSIKVLDSSSKLVDLGNSGLDLNDPNHATLVVKLPSLPDGVYQVDWQIKLTDGDTSLGEYFFGIGKVTLPTRSAQTPDATLPTTTAAPADASSPIGWILGGVGLVVIVAGVVFFARKK